MLAFGQLIHQKLFGFYRRYLHAAGCTSGRMEGDRREAVVEDSSIA